MRTRFLLPFLLLAASLPAWAQRPHTVRAAAPSTQPPVMISPAPAPLPGSYRFRLDSLLTALNKTQVPTGLLYDRVFPIARLDVFGQRAAADTSRFEHFVQAGQELWYAAYGYTVFDAAPGVRTRAAQHYKAGVVPIGVLHGRFNLLDTLAVQRNLFSQPGGAGGALYDVAGRTQSPYLTRETLVAAALVEAVPAGTVQFKFPTNLRFDNTGNAVQSLTLNFNDGTPTATLLPGGAGTYKSYTTGGEHIIQITARFANGSSKQTFTRLLVTGPSGIARGGNPDFPVIYTCNPMSDERIPLAASILYTDYEGNTYAGNGAVTTYFANCSNRQLTKPVIMLDGIEFGGTEQRYGIDVYSNFLNYYDQGIPKRLGEELRAAGHDVLILDFPDANGAEYVQRNAFVLIQLIQNVNAGLRARSTTPEQLTVIGPSMSGLVSRYALAYMEQKYNDASDPATYRNPAWQHNTRLWLSFDSPQLGANIPIGDQQWLRYYAEVFEAEAAKANLNSLDRPAAREMLVHHYRSTSNTVSGAPGFRDRFQAELDNLGMPAQLRRISVVNGSMAGTRQDGLNSSRQANGCDQAFFFEATTGRIRLFYLRFLTINPLVPTLLSNSFVQFSPDYGQNCITFRGWGLHKTTRREYSTGRPSSISYDVAPGSWRNTQATLASEGTFTDARIKGFLNNVFLGGMHRPSQTTRFYDVVGNHCFIPTVSALALTNPNRDLGQNLSTSNLVCSGETAFDSYFAPVQNEDHITVTAANALYIKDEIFRKTPTPVFTTAPGTLCPNSGATAFSVRTECVATRAGQAQPGTTYTWSSTAGLRIVSGQGSATVMVQPVAGFTGMTTLQVIATRTGCTVSTAVPVSVYVGPAGIGPVVSTGDCAGSYVTLTLNPHNTEEDFQWYFGPSLVHHPQYDGQRSIQYQLPSSGPAFWPVRVTAHDKCNRPALLTFDDGVGVTYTAGCENLRPGQRPALQTYPNPATGSFTVVVPALETKASGHSVAASQAHAVLYNGQGRTVQEVTGSASLTIITENLPAGLYNLVVRQAGRTLRKHIEVAH